MRFFFRTTFHHHYSSVVIQKTCFTMVFLNNVPPFHHFPFQIIAFYPIYYLFILLRIQNPFLLRSAETFLLTPLFKLSYFIHSLSFLSPPIPLFPFCYNLLRLSRAYPISIYQKYVYSLSVLPPQPPYSRSPTIC